MTLPSVSDEEFISVWNRLRSPEQVARVIGVNVRNVYARRTRIEQRLNIVLAAETDMTNRAQVNLPKRGHRHTLKITNGMAVVFSDAHFWPNDDRSTAYLALIELIKEYKPKIVIANGDIFDGARISRHPPIGWANLPEVADELAACQERMAEIEAIAKLARKDVMLAWSAGNHDSRFAVKLATVAPDYIRVHGTDLKDHFPAWSLAWSAELNGHTMVKHRWHNGIHATWNNVLKSGRNIVTSHLHRLMVTAYSDYNGRRWGVDTGTLAEFGPEHDKNTWGEDNPFNWCEGFATLSFDDKGRLLPPELCECIDGRAYFRGQVVVAKPKRRAK